MGVYMKCNINGVIVEGTVEEILEFLAYEKKEAPKLDIVPIEKVHGLTGVKWSPKRRARLAERMTEVWAKRLKKHKTHNRRSPVWSKINGNKILPPALNDIGRSMKHAWSRDKILSHLARPHNNDLNKAVTDFDALLINGTLQVTKNGLFKAPYGVTRMI